MTCTFFGNRQINENIQGIVEETIINLIEHESADSFYIGNQGEFDRIAYNVLTKLKKQHAHINFWVVLPYIPKLNSYFHHSQTVFPEAVAKAPKKFAIDARNKWMILQADTIITYTAYTCGNTAKYKELAKKRAKKIIELCRSY